jgi:hypothetical protein
VASLFSRHWAESEYTWWLLIRGNQWHDRGASPPPRGVLANSMGIPFFVVRNPKGDSSAVQTPSDDHEIIATIDPPSQPDHKLE